MRAKLTILSALAVGIAAGAIAGCQTYDFEPVNPLALGQTTVLRKVEAKGLKPNMMLLVDTSGSMNTPVACGSASCPTRWQELQGAMNTFLTQSGTVARLGLTTYPQTAVGTLPEACTASSQVLKDLPAPDVEETDAQLQARASEINAAIQRINSSQSGAPKVVGGTPTSLSLQFVGQQATLAGADRVDLVLLLTDGVPNCNPANPVSGISDPAACKCTLGAGGCNTSDSERLGCLDSNVSVQRVQELKNKEIGTVVIGFGAETTSGDAVNTLNAMADAGGYPRSCPAGQTCTKFYAAANQAELAAALRDISERVGTVDPCIVALTPDQIPTDNRLLVVKLTADGVTRTAELDTDYKVTAAGVEMIGATCDRIKQSTPRDPVTLEVFAVQAK